jgi:hypothetical protein
MRVDHYPGVLTLLISLLLIMLALGPPITIAAAEKENPTPSLLRERARERVETPTTTPGGNETLYLPMVTLYPNLGPNLLPNGSFEGGWYHPDGIPELQIPEAWQFAWDEGPTGFGNEPWDVWVRPEVRVLPSQQLPPQEHDLFIWHGNQTLKIFKGWGAISFRLTTQLHLPPGTYLIVINYFPDLVADYQNGEKIFADDPYAGEVAFIVNGQQTDWELPRIGQQDQKFYRFTLTAAGTYQIGVAMRGRYALDNNGWFMDMWSLQQVRAAE